MWNSPLLSFDIERHGAAALGSIYPEIQHWIVNVDTGEADLESSGRRQIGERARPLNVKPMTDALAAAIISQKDHPGLKWHNDRKVKVLVSSVVSATNNQTLSARRKRFWKSLEETVNPLGWSRASTRSTFLHRQL